MTLQDLLALGFQQTPDGKLFLPWSKTDFYNSVFTPQASGESGYMGWGLSDAPNEAPGTYTNQIQQRYETPEEALRSQAQGTRASFGNDQNAFSWRNAEAINLDGTLGYKFAPSDLMYGSSHKGTGTGWNDFREGFVIPALSLWAGSGGITNAIDSIAANATSVADIGAVSGAGEAVGGGALYGGTGSDVLSSGGSTDNYFSDYIGYEGDTGYFGDYGNASFDGSGVDQFGNPTGEFVDTGALSRAGSGDFFSTGIESNPTFIELAKKYGTSAAKYIMGKLGGGAGDGSGTFGRSILNQFGSDPLGSAFSATPFLLALAEANRQGGDINQTIGRLRELESSVAGNASPYMDAVLNPYDRETVTGRAALLQDQGLRGIRGSSFGDQSLSSYDYTRGVGRGDIASKALLGSTALQGNLIGSELDAITKRNTNRNLLLGAGLSASGRLFKPEQDQSDWIRALFGAPSNG